jgi:hypothetical protein
MDYPDNSYASRERRVAEDNPEKSEPLVKGKVIRGKKSIGSRIAEVFSGEDARSVVNSVIWDTLVPTIRDAMTEAIVQSIERMFRGESRPPSRRPGYRPSDDYRRHNYRQYTPPSRDERTRPPAGRRPRGGSNLSYRNILLESRADADNVMHAMEDKLSRFGSVSVAELYRILDVDETEIDYTDEENGWFSARGWDVRWEQDGYRLVFSRTEPLRD